MIDILRSDKINNRLLCELVTHKSFQRFLVDAETYIDRIVDMRVNDINTFLKATRQQVLQQPNTSENDLYVRTLEVAQVDESWSIRQKNLELMQQNGSKTCCHFVKQ